MVTEARSKLDSDVRKGVRDNSPDMGSITHRLKCWPEFFEAICLSQKTHDLRRSDDRHFKVGDLVLLREFEPKSESYSGREVIVRISYITSVDSPCAFSSQALDLSFCILSIQLVGPVKR